MITHESWIAELRRRAELVVELRGLLAKHQTATSRTLLALATAIDAAEAEASSDDWNIWEEVKKAYNLPTQ